MKTKLLLPHFLTLAVAVSFGPQCAGAAEAGDEANWIKDPVTGCKVWDPHPAKGEAVSWSGDCKNGKADGSGVLVWFEDGRLEGRFRGHLELGKAQGIGELDIWTKTGYAHYDGEFKDSELSGWGALTLSDKSHAEGEFTNNKPDGFIDCTYADGSHYWGDVKNGVPDGQGDQALANNEEYHGQFREGVREGDGTLLLPNGDTYVGAFKAGVAEGKGKLQKADGAAFDGMFHKGTADGEGTLTDTEGKTTTGRIVNGKFEPASGNGDAADTNAKHGKKAAR